MSKVELHWKGDEVYSQVQGVVADGLRDWLLETEGQCKGVLYPGHGEDTGSLKRSIHAAAPDYNWPSDHSYPNGPERGGRSFEPLIGSENVSAAIGSGQKYAIFYHQGTRTIRGDRFIVRPVFGNSKRLVSLIEQRASTLRVK